MVEWGAVDMLPVPSRQSSSIPFLTFMDGSRSVSPSAMSCEFNGAGTAPATDISLDTRLLSGTASPRLAGKASFRRSFGLPYAVPADALRPRCLSVPVAELPPDS